MSRIDFACRWLLAAVHLNGRFDPALEMAFGESGAGKRRIRLNAPVSLQRIILGLGVAVLAAISATSIALDVKSRSDAAWVRHTLEALNKLSDMRLSFRRAESAARGYLLTDNPNYLNEYHQFLGRIASAFSELKQAVNDNPAQIRLLESSEPTVARRFAATSETIRLKTTGDAAGMAAVTAVHQGRLDQGVMLLSKPYRKSELARMVRLALGNAAADSVDSASIPLAAASIAVPMLRPPAAGQALA